jgi:predicted unusual protein kinase regulating ubiquinone biosynthesis (AarF/ABC1/UbiB family)
MAKRKELENLKTKLFSRGFSLARTGLKAAQIAAGQAVKTALSSAETSEAGWAKYLTKQAEMLAGELGQLKGSAQKVGQLISTYGEHFLPPEANAWLKSLQTDSPTLAWPAIEKQLIRELGPELLGELEISPEPHAAASIGQVHRARRKRDGQELAVKIQYPGVDSAIETDLRFLKAILSVGPLLPKGPRFDAIFSEVRNMLYREVDYFIELEITNRMHEMLKDDSRYRVPRTFPEYCTKRILATEFMGGTPVDSPEVKNLPLERRNRLGEIFLDLYLRELLEFRMVQTDPHFGNYRLSLGSGPDDQLVLFDFGATRDVPDNYLYAFVKVMEGGLLRDRDLIIEGGTALKLVLEDDPAELKDLYVELCYLITEPFAGGAYDWGASDLPKRVAIKGAEVVKRFHLRAPPQETVFLDRKLGGTFVFLSALGCKADYRSLILSRLEKFKLMKK